MNLMYIKHIYDNLVNMDKFYGQSTVLYDWPFLELCIKRAKGIHLVFYCAVLVAPLFVNRFGNFCESGF